MSPSQVYLSPAAAPKGNTWPPVVVPQQQPHQSPGAYPEDVPGMTYMTTGPGTSMFPVAPGGIPSTDNNGVVMLQPSPSSPGGGVFMMVVHGMSSTQEHI